MSIGDVKATIRQGNEAAEKGKLLLSKVADDVAETTALAVGVLNGSNDGDVRRSLDLLDTIEREVELAQRCYTRAIKHASSYLRSLG